MKRLVFVIAVGLMAGFFDNPVMAAEAPGASLKMLTSKVILLADNQERSSLGVANFAVSSLIDRLITDVAKRPSQQELFSKYLMKSIIDKEGAPVIHLGDLLDMGCRYEWNQVKAVISGNKNLILMPGNHDGFMQGNFYKNNIRLVNAWAGLCDEGRFYGNQHHRELLTHPEITLPCSPQINTTAPKPFLINEYLAVLAESRYPSLKNKAFDHHGSVSAEGSWENDSKKDLIQKAAWKTCKNPQDFSQCRGYESYLIQLVKLPSVGEDSPPVYLLLLDTAQYANPLSLSVADALRRHAAGIKGDVQENQRRKALEWAEYVVQNEKGYILLAGHHPFAKLTGSTQRWVKQVAGKTGTYFYLSAHTHEGWFAPTKDNELTELNVGSISDWPIHHRTLSVGLDEGRLWAQSEYKPVDAELIQDLTGCACDEKWYVDDPNSPLSIKHQEDKITVKSWEDLRKKAKTNLLLYKHMLDSFPGGNTGKVRYAKVSAADCDPKTTARTFRDVEELKGEVVQAITTFDSVKDFRPAVRLANTINDYYYDDKEKDKLLNAYKICLAVWASKRDAQESPARTLFEAPMDENLGGLFTSRYDQIAKTEKLREKKWMVINQAPR